MIIRVKELCRVDCINEGERKTDEKLTAIRTVDYESTKGALLEAYEDYIHNFDSDKIISSNDEFDGECLDTILELSVERVTKWTIE